MPSTDIYARCNFTRSGHPTHIYFGPSNSVSLVTAEEMRGLYDVNPKAYVQGWKDGWSWASKQPTLSGVGSEEQGRQLYGDIDSFPGITQFYGFLGAMAIVQGLRPGQSRI
jgi:hypothetical protein